ncbi:MAG: methyltransferase domain-containing protein [Polyangiales bacterium]
MTSRADFLAFCRKCVEQNGRQGRDYLDHHALRFWSTYRVCERLIGPGSALLSVGAGSAYVEHALVRFRGVAVTVVDFPSAIAAHAAEYRKSHFNTIAHDLTKPLELEERFTLALSAEIIEHIPQEPQKHIAQLAQLLAAGARPGHLVVTTPNLANLRNLMRLVCMQPIMPPAHKFFGDVCYENEDVHRREYVPSEIRAAFLACGLTHRGTHYTENALVSGTKKRLFASAAKLAPRFAQTMILVGRRDAPPLTEAAQHWPTSRFTVARGWTPRPPTASNS